MQLNTPYLATFWQLLEEILFVQSGVYMHLTPDLRTESLVPQHFLLSVTSIPCIKRSVHRTGFIPGIESQSSGILLEQFWEIPWLPPGDAWRALWG
jgi:hypothetical protein